SESLSLRSILTLIFCLAGLIFCFTPGKRTNSKSSTQATESKDEKVALSYPPEKLLTPPINQFSQSLAFLEKRIDSDDRDFMAMNKLAGLYLKRHRQSGDHKDLDLARKLATRSLKTFPARVNKGAVALEAQIDFASHDFAGAAKNARLLFRLDPRKNASILLLGDALLESGQVNAAAEVVEKILTPRIGESSGAILDLQIRLAKLDHIRGRPESSERHFKVALSSARDLSSIQNGAITWCLWQAGERAFARGAYRKAAAYHCEALELSPGYPRAIADLGRCFAAVGQRKEGLGLLVKAIELSPQFRFIAALADLQELEGRTEQAFALRVRLEAIARHKDGVEPGLIGPRAAINHHARDLALFYANHDIKLEEALRLAEQEILLRKDIYSYDVLAWTLFKTGRLEKAQEAMRKALQYKTQEAHFYYHSGMIKAARGDIQAAIQSLKTALKISPEFDPRQAPIAAAKLRELSSRQS
ncbi:MAG: tetratricopeptide repeat protein, partial [Planctomycetota bacterium]|nr:tetratricopeptide repeat protein [Planctomycetota bacterium]